MENSSLQQERISEKNQLEQRSKTVLRIGAPLLRNTALTEKKEFEETDVQKFREFFIAVASHTHEKLNSSYWDHLLLASIYARKLAEKTGIGNPLEMEAAALGHDLGKLVYPHRYYMNDVVTFTLGRRLGIRREFLDLFPPIGEIVGVAWDPIKTSDQISPEQQLLDIADNLGKLNADGSLFNFEQLIENAKGQSRRYGQTIWTMEKNAVKELSEHGKQGFANAVLLGEGIKIRNGYKVDFNSLREEVAVEFQKPENQKWLTDVKTAQKSLV